MPVYKSDLALRNEQVAPQVGVQIVGTVTE